MRFEDLRKLEERFAGAADDVDRLAGALAKDIRDNPTIPPAEMKFKVQTMLAATSTINIATAMMAEMAYRLAGHTVPLEEIDILAQQEGFTEAKIGDEAGEGKSGLVVNGRIVMTGSAAGKTPPERESNEVEGTDAP